MMERLRKRKENHNHIERKRRDHINHTIFELANILPQMDSKDIKANKGSILKATLQHIKVHIHRLQMKRIIVSLFTCSCYCRTSKPKIWRSVYSYRIFKAVPVLLRQAIRLLWPKIPMTALIGNHVLHGRPSNCHPCHSNVCKLDLLPALHVIMNHLPFTSMHNQCYRLRSQISFDLYCRDNHLPLANSVCRDLRANIQVHVGTDMHTTDDDFFFLRRHQAPDSHTHLAFFTHQHHLTPLQRNMNTSLHSYL